MWSRPRPVGDTLSEAFWAAATEEVLVVQRCRRCGHYQHPPRPRCVSCHADGLEFDRVGGRGRLWSWMVTRTPAVRSFRDRIPYLLALVELEEQADLLMLTDLDMRSLQLLEAGLPMRVRFDRIEEGASTFTLPRWEPAACARS